MISMKKLAALFTVMCFILPVFAAIPAGKIQNPPKGTFKRAKNGTIVQYDANGKKIGIYKLTNQNSKKKK